MRVFNTEFDKFLVSDAQYDSLQILSRIRKGGIGSVINYRPESGWVSRPTVNIQFITAFSTAKLYERRAKALRGMTFGDICVATANVPKLSVKSKEELVAIFEQRRSMLLGSIEKTQSGDRSDAHRQAHDRNYARVGAGVKVNYVTEKNDDGFQVPVLHDGVPVAQSVMVSMLELGRQYVVEGERKVVNSGAPVLMGNLIEAHMLSLSKSNGLRMLSLKSNNFTALRLDKQEFVPEDVEGFDSDFLV